MSAPDAMPLTVFYGGTFDPVHNGHLAVARSARDALDATIHWMPAADPPHRAAPGASALQRACMLDLAVAGETGMQVDRRELRRQTRSYTIDTLREVRGQLGAQAPVALLIGADSLLELASWKQWQALFTLAHFVVAERHGNALEARLPAQVQAITQGRWVADAAQLRTAAAGRLLRLRQPLHPESASDIRARIAGALPWRHLVPAAVADYIDRHQLYSRRPAASAPL